MVNLDTVFIAMVSMGGLVIFFSFGLSIAEKKLHVDQDTRIREIIDLLQEHIAPIYS